MSALPSASSATTDMELELPPLTENLNAQQARGSDSGEGIPVVGNGIDDPANDPKNRKRKTCHQCRQKVEGFLVTCKNLKKGKPCVIKYCPICLSNRYGEDAKHVDLLDNWNCPKCRGKCNCSYCRSRKGLPPTGNLTREARASGFRSVSELLATRDAANLDRNANVDAAVLPLEEIDGFEAWSANDFTGNLTREARASGFRSVSELLATRDAANLDRNANVDAAVLPLEEIDGFEAWSANDFPTIPHQKDETECNTMFLIDYDVAGDVSQDEIFAAAERKPHTDDKMEGGPEVWGANDFFDATIFAPNNGYAMRQVTEEKIDEIPLPPGNELKEIVGIEFSHEDVGNAWQFLEFCRVFGKVLDMEKGEAETILRELVRKQNLRSGENTLAVEFQTRLLTLILINSGHKSPSLTTIDGNSSWLKALGDLASQSALVLKDFPLEMLYEGLSGYCNLSLSHKLRLLTFMCDEVLCTEKVRSHIEEENSNLEQQKKEAKAQVAAAKEKLQEISLKQKLQEETDKTVQSNGDSVSLSEQHALLPKLGTEVAQAHSEMLEAKAKIPKSKISDATRIEPEFVDGSGQKFWKLKSYEGEDAVLLQDIKIQGDGTAIDERWFVYGPEKKHEIDKYISSRAKRTKSRKAPYKFSNGSRYAELLLGNIKLS